MRRLTVDVECTDGDARTGVVRTERGAFATPVFMPVGTRGTVKALAAPDLETLGAEVVLGNTYHLMLRPGSAVVAEAGGLGAFSGWSGHTLTDSGGYQVFSLSPKVDDDGVTFTSTYDGSTHRLTPEGAVEVQEQIGADIQMVLDVCAPLPSPAGELRLAVERTASWAARAKRHHRRDDQSLFGIVQGGVDVVLRREAAQRTVEIGFDGYAVGGLSVGERRDEMLPALAAALSELPAGQPRYLMGVGDPVGMVEAVALGVDMFDCVLPTRLARHGSILTDAGKLNLRNAANLNDHGPLDAACPCMVCGRWGRAYLRHLLIVNEPTALRLLTWHNVAWTLRLLMRTRDAIRTGTLDVLRREVRAVWETSAH